MSEGIFWSRVHFNSNKAQRLYDDWQTDLRLQSLKFFLTEVTSLDLDRRNLLQLKGRAQTNTSLDASNNTVLSTRILSKSFQLDSFCWNISNYEHKLKALCNIVNINLIFIKKF